MHNRLASDGRFAFPKVYDVVAPHTFLLLKPIAPIGSYFLPRTRFSADNMALDVTIHGPLGTVRIGRKGTGTFFGLHAFTRRKAETGRKMSQSPAACERLPLDVEVSAEDEAALSVMTLLSPAVGFAFPERADHYDRYLTYRVFGGTDFRTARGAGSESLDLRRCATASRSRNSIWPLTLRNSCCAEASSSSYNTGSMRKGKALCDFMTTVYW